MNGICPFIKKMSPFVWTVLNILILHFLLPFYPWLVAAFAILGVTIFFQYRDYFLFLSSILYVLTFCSEKAFFGRLGEKLNFEIVIVAIAALAIYFLCIVFLYIYKKYISHFQILLLFLLLILLRVLVTYLDNRYAVFAVSSIFYIIKMHFWYFVFGPHIAKENLISYLFCMTNPAQSVYLIPTSPHLFIESKNIDKLDLTLLQKRSAQFLSGLLLIRLIYKYLTEATPNFNIIENVHSENILGFISFKYYGVFEHLQNLFQHLGYFGIFISIVTMGLLVISNAIIFCGIAISFYMCVGFDMPPFIKVFWNSKYFHRMLSQLMPYYNRAIVDIFYTRIGNLLTSLKLRRFTLLNIYLTIALGGVLLSLWKNLARSYPPNIVQEMLRVLDGSSYFFIVAALSTFSMYRERKDRKSIHADNKWTFMYFLGYLFLFTVLLNARMLTHKLHFNYVEVLKMMGL